LTTDGPYRLTTPCADCPFLREGGVRLTLARVRQIAGGMLKRSGGEFSCHKTTGVEGKAAPGGRAHCAGALLFAEKNGNATQMMRIAERLRLYAHWRLRGHERVFDTLAEMEATAIDRK
jgi:hypothetical protein